MRSVVLLVVLIVSWASSGIDAPSSSPPTASSSPTQPHRLSQGEALYLRHCADCHGWEGRGDGPVARIFEVKAPRLRGAERFARFREAELMQRILYGVELPAGADPQAQALTESEVTALLTFMRRLPTLPWGQIRQGQEVYDSLCVYCHGVYGRGDGIMAEQLPAPPKDLSSPAFQGQVSDEELLRVLADGKGAMPGMGDILSRSDLQAVTTFVRLLSPGFERYNRFCAVCHGTDGHPRAQAFEDSEEDSAAEEIPTVVFNQAYFLTHSEAHVRDRVRHMLRQSRAIMPHFAGELSKDEIRQILAYLRTLP